MSGGWSVGELRPADAEDVAGWRYPPPYATYDVDLAAHDLLAAERRFHAVRDADGRLAGYCCLEDEARVPGGAYVDRALDVGWGMRPDLTGQGHGGAFVGAIVEFARMQTEVPLRVTIAEWNLRSQRAAASAGFSDRRERFADAGGTPFLVFLRAAGRPIQADTGSTR